MKISFPPGGYTAADYYDISFDMIDYHQCNLNPQPIQGQQQSSPAGIKLSDAQYFHGSAPRSRSLIGTTAPVGKGIGLFQQKITISCGVHENSLPGRYLGAMHFMMY